MLEKHSLINELLKKSLNPLLRYVQLDDTLNMEFEYLSDGTKKIIDIPKKYLDEYDFIKNNCFLAKLKALNLHL